MKKILLLTLLLVYCSHIKEETTLVVDSVVVDTLKFELYIYNFKTGLSEVPPDTILDYSPYIPQDRETQTYFQYLLEKGFTQEEAGKEALIKWLLETTPEMMEL